MNPQFALRAKAMIALIISAMQMPNAFERRMAVGAVGPYHSRGKRKTRHHPVKAHARVQRAARKARNVARNRRARTGSPTPPN